MNTDISIKVAEKIATVIGSPAIICGNSDYVINFTFDKEWETLNYKTARFIYKTDGALQFIDVTFTGSRVAVPILSKVEEVYIGVYAGDLHTTTPTRILCVKSILCDDPEQHIDPPADVYSQLLELINNAETLPQVTENEAGKALMVNEEGHWVVRCPDFIHDLNTDALVRFFFGTMEEWENWEGDKQDVVFVPVDLDFVEELEKVLSDMDEELTKTKTALTTAQTSLKTTQSQLTTAKNDIKTLQSQVKGELVLDYTGAYSHVELQGGKTFEAGKKYRFICEEGEFTAIIGSGEYDSIGLNTVTQGYPNDGLLRVYSFCPKRLSDTALHLYGLRTDVDAPDFDASVTLEQIEYKCSKVYKLLD